MAKTSFILYLDQFEAINELSDSRAGKLLKAIFHYVRSGEEDDLDQVTRMAFIPIKQTLNRDLDKWNRIADRNRENIKKRYQTLPEPTKSTSGRTGIPNAVDSVSVSVSDSVSVSEYNKRTSGTKTATTPYEENSLEHAHKLLDLAGTFGDLQKTKGGARHE